jgi:hypothetical protein
MQTGCNRMRIHINNLAQTGCTGCEHRVRNRVHNDINDLR